MPLSNMLDSPSPPEAALGQARPAVALSAADFLAWETQQPSRHEYVDGEVFAMAGGDDRHMTVAGNVYMALRQHLRGSPCSVYMSEVRTFIQAANCYFYPDVFVTCSDRDRAERLHKHDPLLVVEVLSPSTAAFDRGARFAAYRQADSLQEVVFIDTDSRLTDVHRKGADGLWVLHPFAAGDSMRLASVDLLLPPELLWADVPDGPR